MSSSTTSRHLDIDPEQTFASVELIETHSEPTHERVTFSTMERREKIKKVIKNNRLLLGVLAGVVIGCIIGITSHDAVQSSHNPSPKRLAMYLKFPGELFIRMLKMIVIPLICSSIIVALTDIDISSAGRLGKRAMVYYLTTTVASAILGLILASIIKPGDGVNEKNESSANIERNSMDSFLDLLRNVFPDNIVQAFVSSTFTDYKMVKEYSYKVKNISLSNMSAAAMANLLENDQVVTWSSRDGHVTVIGSDVTYDFGGVARGGGTNMIGLIAFSIAFGIVLNIIQEEGKPLVSVATSLWSASMKLVEIIMWLAPLGICSVVAGNIVETKDITLLFRAMGLFVLTNVLGHLIQVLLLYPGLYLIFMRRLPFQHIKSILPAILTAFGTSSSAATLPTTIECCESGAKIDRRVTRFVLPIGATCNMDGAAIYYAIVVLFIEQIEPNVELGIGNKILTILICTCVSIGAAGIPSPGLSNLVIVLEAVGLPVDKIGPIFAVDWLLDRLQTMVNVMGDTFAAAIVGKYSQNDLKFEEISANKNKCGTEYVTENCTLNVGDTSL